MNENNASDSITQTDSTNSNFLPNDYTDTLNSINDSIKERNKTLESINNNLDFLKNHFEITEEEQKIIDSELKKENEESSKQKEKDIKEFFTLLNENSLNNIQSELQLLNEKTSQNNLVVNDSSQFISFSFILLLGLLVSFYVIKFIKSIFDSFYNF